MRPRLSPLAPRRYREAADLPSIIQIDAALEARLQRDDDAFQLLGSDVNNYVAQASGNELAPALQLQTDYLAFIARWDGFYLGTRDSAWALGAKSAADQFEGEYAGLRARFQQLSGADPHAPSLPGPPQTPLQSAADSIGKSAGQITLAVLAVAAAYYLLKN